MVLKMFSYLAKMWQSVFMRMRGGRRLIGELGLRRVCLRSDFGTPRVSFVSCKRLSVT